MTKKNYRKLACAVALATSFASLPGVSSAEEGNEPETAVTAQADGAATQQSAETVTAQDVGAENALQKANVQLVKGVLPYQFNEMKDFNMGYLSGFMAEKRDIEQKAVEGNMQATMKNSAEKLMRESVQGYNALSVNSFGVIPKKEDWSYALLPVWTVTYKGKDGKIYYYSMNGQTGKVFGELPVDYGKVTLTGIISAVVVLIIALIGGYFL